ncbi:Protein tincar [Strongyloides ratti]|uniref:Protein tincar n=1 Tax=Strongyloides ratti TaxID=34506 RepID=A0A090KXP5_STRRB|nr:Protein tincar [Strongyloides ratti]CEF60023.1 Protein tincar [Strongyloides ratti]
MGCKFKIRLNSLSSIWYTFGIILLQIYLLYLGFERYRLYLDVKWPQHQYPKLWLTTYMILYSSCIPLTMIFFIVGFFKSGNLTGDREQLGFITLKVCEKIDIHLKSCCCNVFHFITKIYRNFLPFPQILHLTIAFCQLIAQQIMLAQMYRFGFANTNDIIHTEMDFIYKRSNQLALNLPVGDTRLQGFRITSEELSFFPISPNLLPVLMHTKLFGISLEFVNLLIALLALSQRYPKLFWKTNETFSIIFSLFMIIHSITIVYGYLAFSILYRIQETNRYNIRPLTIGLPISSSKNLIFYHPISLIFLFLFDIIIMLLAPVALHLYGLSKFRLSILSVKEKMSLLHNKLSTTISGNGYYTTNNSDLSTSQESNTTLCCDGYGPHMLAILVLVLTAISQCPTIYALMILHQYENKTILLHCIIVRVAYLFIWIILWLILTLRKNWQFKVTHPVNEIINLQNAQKVLNLSNEENESQDKRTLSSRLKNSMLIMQGDYMYLTNDVVMKQSIISLVHKNKVENGMIVPKYKTSPIVKRVMESDRPSPLPLHRNYDFNQQNLYGSRSGSQVQLNNGPLIATHVRMSPAKDQMKNLNNYQLGMASSTYNTIKPNTFISSNDSKDRNFVNTFGTLQRSPRGLMGMTNDDIGTIRNHQSMMKNQQYGVIPDRQIQSIRYSPNRQRQQLDPKLQGASIYGTYNRNPPLPLSSRQINLIPNKQSAQYGINKESNNNNKILTPQPITKNSHSGIYGEILTNKSLENSTYVQQPTQYISRDINYGNYGYNKMVSNNQPKDQSNSSFKKIDDKYDSNFYGQIPENTKSRKINLGESQQNKEENIYNGKNEYATSIV